MESHIRTYMHIWKVRNKKAHEKVWSKKFIDCSNQSINQSINQPINQSLIIEGKTPNSYKTNKLVVLQKHPCRCMLRKPRYAFIVLKTLARVQNLLHTEMQKVFSYFTFSFIVALTVVRDSFKRLCIDWRSWCEAFCAPSTAWSAFIKLFISVYPFSKRATLLLMLLLVLLSPWTRVSSSVTLTANLSLILSVKIWFWRSSFTVDIISLSFLLRSFTELFSCLNSVSSFFSKAWCVLVMFTHTPSTVATWQRNILH